MMGPLGTVMMIVKSGVGFNFNLNLNVKYVDTKCAVMIWKLREVNPHKAFRTDELNQDLMLSKS